MTPTPKTPAPKGKPVKFDAYDEARFGTPDTDEPKAYRKLSEEEAEIVENTIGDLSGELCITVACIRDFITSRMLPEEDEE